MTSKGNDPWSEFRKDNGEFRRWLHVWHYGSTDLEPQMCRECSVQYPWAPLPWVLPADQPLSGEMLIALYNMGVTARWPAEWPRFTPPDVGTYRVPIYGLITDQMGDAKLMQHLRKVSSQCLGHNDFMQKMSRYVLFPKPKEKMNANSRSTKDRWPLV